MLVVVLVVMGVLLVDTFGVTCTPRLVDVVEGTTVVVMVLVSVVAIG